MLNGVTRIAKVWQLFSARPLPEMLYPGAG
ncbi:hypothetical protein JOH51_007406 [Rhizobium leguminosarum]|nr:hypothetical protein [Rhizobium leguminosarum]MBP2449898.1 hypothetical protein [Rhizobium leguminosarum]